MGTETLTESLILSVESCVKVCKEQKLWVEGVEEGGMSGKSFATNKLFQLVLTSFFLNPH